MVTLEKIVESLKLQLKPHLTDDQILHDEWIIDMINFSRATLIRALYVSEEPLTAFFQITFGITTDFDAHYKKLTLPCKLMQGIGKRNIRYFGPDGTNKPQYHYCSFEELASYEYHRFGGSQIAFADVGAYLQLNTTAVGPVEIHAIFEQPNTLIGYFYQTTAYPIGENNERQLEIITFQHIAAKLGMPVDFANNGVDETKNVPVKQPQQQQQQDNGGQ
jgi:hypothetical protein